MLHGGLGQPLRSQKGEKDPVIQCEERQSPGPRGEKELGVCSGQRGGSAASAGEGRIDQEGRQRHTPEGVGRREVSRPGSHTTCLVLERSFWLQCCVANRAGVEARAYCTAWKDHTRQKALYIALPRIKQMEHLHLPPTVNTVGVGQSMNLFQT